MKKIIIPSLIIIMLAASITSAYLYSDYKAEKRAELTDEKLESFTKEDLENHCSKYKIECEIVLEHSENHIVDTLISYDLDSKTFTYSLGDYPVETHSLSWGAVGDVIIYTFDPFWNGSEYDYDSLFTEISYKTSSYDISSYTQESAAAGCTSGYPLFCTPYEFIRTMEGAGFDIANMTNNHSLDLGHDGQERALINMDNYNLLTVGTYKIEDTDALPKIYEHEEFRIGVLSYAEHLNGFQAQAGLEHTVSMYSKDKMEIDVEYLKNQNVDFIITFMHWGAEYTDEPSAEQKSIAQDLADANIDVVLGSHSHSLNPVDVISSTDNSSTTLVAYSLGNFQAAQHPYIFDTAYGGILEFELTKQVKNGEVLERSVENIKFFPTFNKPREEGLIIQPLKESDYSHKFDSICEVVTMYKEIECYN